MIPWDKIQLRWIQGESASSISKSFGGTPTRQGISKRARNECWNQLPTVSKKHRELSPMQLGRDTPRNREIILKRLAEGVPYHLAAGAIGVSRNTLLNWRNADPRLEAQCSAARNEALADCAATVFHAKEKDWKAGKYLLETAPETRDEFGPNRRDNKLEVVINIDRRASGVIIEGSSTEND